MTTKRLYSIKSKDWPSKIREAWNEAQLLPDGSACELSPRSIGNIEYFVGQYLSYRRNLGLDDSSCDVLQIATLASVKVFAQAYSQDHASSSTAAALVAIASFVRHCHSPDGNPALARLAYIYEKKIVPKLPKLPRMATLAELVDLGEALIKEARPKIGTGLTGPYQQFRDGLMILMLASHPLRRSRFAKLRFGETLHHENGRWRFALPESETAGKWENTREYPAFVCEYINAYLQLVRPFFIARQHEDLGYLWVGDHGHMSSGAIYEKIKRLTLRHLGRGVPVHLFRHSVATDIASNNPKEVSIVTDVLSHKDAASDQYYLVAKTAESFERYDAVLDANKTLSLESAKKTEDEQ